MSVHPGRVIIGMMACLVMLGAGRLFDTIHRALVDNPSARFDGMLIQWRFWLFGVFEDVVNLEMDKTWQDVWFRGSKLG